MPHSHCAICEADFLYSDCVEGGRSDLARKVLEVVERERDYNQTAQDYSRRNVTYERAINDVTAALRQLFQAEGVALLPQREEQGGEGRST